MGKFKKKEPTGEPGGGLEATGKSGEDLTLSAEEIAALEAEKLQVLANLGAQVAPVHVAAAKKWTKPGTIATAEPAPTEGKATTLGSHTAELAARAEAARLTAELDASDRTAMLEAKLSPLLTKARTRRAALAQLDRDHGVDLAKLAFKSHLDAPAEWPGQFKMAFQEKVCNRAHALLADLKRGLAGHTQMVEDVEGLLARGWQPGRPFELEVEELTWKMKISEGTDTTFAEDVLVFSRQLSDLIERADRSATMPGPKSEIILAGPKPIPATPAPKLKADTDFDPFKS